MEPKYLKRWTLPKYYFGEEWPEYYVAIYTNRDADCLTRANYDAMFKALGGESETVFKVSESHWACGWVEWIAIHESDTKAIEIADDILGKLEAYPVVDEELWSEYEDEECQQVWKDCYNLKERIELCVEAGLSIFVARHEWYPYDLRDRLIS